MTSGLSEPAGLQWGRDKNVSEISVRKSDMYKYTPLQWGRDKNVSEMSK